MASIKTLVAALILTSVCSIEQTALSSPLKKNTQVLFDDNCNTTPVSNLSSLTNSKLIPTSFVGDRLFLSLPAEFKRCINDDPYSSSGVAATGNSVFSYKANEEDISVVVYDGWTFFNGQDLSLTLKQEASKNRNTWEIAGNHFSNTGVLFVPYSVQQPQDNQNTWIVKKAIISTPDGLFNLERGARRIQQKNVESIKELAERILDSITLGPNRNHGERVASISLNDVILTLNVPAGWATLESTSQLTMRKLPTLGEPEVAKQITIELARSGYAIPSGETDKKILGQTPCWGNSGKWGEVLLPASNNTYLSVRASSTEAISDMLQLVKSFKLESKTISTISGK